jgi:hypothetical protein
MRKLAAVAVSIGLVVVGVVPVAPAHSTTAVFCDFATPQDPHISTFNYKNHGTIDIKAGARGQCEAGSDPVIVTAQVYLEKEILPFVWLPVAFGAPVSKSINGVAPFWGVGELFAVLAPCVPGTYRSVLTRDSELEGTGIHFHLGEDLVGRATPIDCKRSQVSMVIDDTGSMSSVIGSVSSSLGSFIQSRPDDEYTRWDLTTFKDSPNYVGTTEDRDQALSWVGALTASGGDDCPEDALGGISNGLAALSADPDTDKQMIVATDASAHGGDIDGIISAAQASGTHVNVLLAGDCGYPSAAATTATTSPATADYPYEVSSQVVLRRIAEETGGRYFFIPGGSTADYTAALNAIFAGIANPGEDAQPPTVTVSGVPSTIWSPNHKMVEVTPTVTATDNEDPSPVVHLVGVTVSQPDDGQGDGSTSNDIVVTSDGRVFVRAERSATEGARTYTITYRATDRSGNTGFGSATVVVPKDNSGK